jgi:hypothetical protein
MKQPTNKSKLDDLVRIEGISEMKMLETAVMDSVCKGICTNEGCSYITDVEPDQTEGYCEVCGTTTVRSCLSLAGII